MTTFTASVAAMEDDGVEAVTLFYDNTAGLAVGDTSGFTLDSNMRFTGVTVAQGATVSSATITLYNMQINGAHSAIARWYGFASNDAPQCSDSAGLLPSDCPKTTAFTAFTSSTGTVVQSVTSVVQEILNRAGWVSGNAINLIVKNNGSVTSDNDQWDSFDTGTPPLLTITYTTGAAFIAKPQRKLLQAVNRGATY